MQRLLSLPKYKRAQPRRERADRRLEVHQGGRDRPGEDLGLPLVGIVDLILDGRDGPVITDFKTSARSSEPLEIVHEIQLSSYAYLFRHVEQRQEAGLEIRSLIKTKVAKVEFHAYPARTDAHFRRLFAVVREYLDRLDVGRFNYRPGFGCAMCDFRSQCARWAGRAALRPIIEPTEKRRLCVGARKELNKHHVIGALGLAGLIGLASGSWAVFAVVAAALHRRQRLRGRDPPRQTRAAA